MLVLHYISKKIVGATNFLWCCCQHLNSFDCGFAGEPQNLVEGTTDPFKTLFVARISLDVTERKLVKEYSRFGTITKCVLIMDNEEEPRGYAFLEFEKESDMREAYKKGEAERVGLAKQAELILDRAEARVERLLEDRDGEHATEPVEVS